MELISRVMPDDYTLVDTGDWHLGNINAHMDGVKEVIERIKQPGVYAILKGDLLDSILPNDKRYSSACVTIPTPMESLNLLTKMLMPVKEKLIGVMLGNHELHLINTLNMAMELAHRLEAPYAGYVCKFRALTEKKRVRHKMLFTHGFRNVTSRAKDPIQRKANQEAGLKLMLDELGHSDCILQSMGHVHKLMVVNPTINNQVIMVDDGKKLHQKYRTHSAQNADYIPVEARFNGCSGSMLKTNTAPGSGAVSYSELFGYGPAELGWIEWIVENGNVVAGKKVIT